ncbi:MAG: homocysteine S-methyltransferase [Acidobacteriaceae bacterium]
MRSLNHLRSLLQAKPTLVLDGGMASELENRGYDISGHLWSAHALENTPEAVEAVHFDYLQAGADCLITASYQISFPGYAVAGYSREQTVAALKKSVQLAGQARNRFMATQPPEAVKPLIAASLGPYGAYLHNGAEYHGNYNCTPEELARFHSERLAILATTNADLIAAETIPSLDEARAIVQILHTFPTIGAWISFSCRDGLHTSHGELVAEAAAALDKEPQVVAIGVNCTAPEHIASLIRQIRQHTAKPIVVYPNSGEGWDAGQRCWIPRPGLMDFGALAQEWQAAGADWIGGCCRTGPEQVRQIRKALEASALAAGSR